MPQKKFSLEVIPELRLTRDGEPIPGSASDPATRHAGAWGMVRAVAILNVALGLLVELFDLTSLRAIGAGWGSLLSGLVSRRREQDPDLPCPRAARQSSMQSNNPSHLSDDELVANERGFVAFHHVQPYAAGGPATPGNIQLRCRAHNGYEADLYYGPGSRPPGNATRPGPSCVAATQPRADDASRPG